MKFERYGLGIAKGLMVTIRYMLRHPVTVQYPEQRLNVSRRIRGNELIWSEVKCTGCATCARSCPLGAIRIVTSLGTEASRYHVDKFEVDTGYCISCGLCVEACPFEALYMGYSYERARYRRQELVQANEGLLESAERRPSGYLYPDLAAKLPRQTLLVEKIVEKQ